MQALELLVLLLLVVRLLILGLAVLALLVLLVLLILLILLVLRAVVLALRIIPVLIVLVVVLHNADILSINYEVTEAVRRAPEPVRCGSLPESIVGRKGRIMREKIYLTILTDQ